MQWRHKETWQIIYLFLFNGTLMGAWASHIPVVVEKFSLSHRSLTLLLLSIAIGAVSSFLISGKLISRFGANCFSLWILAPYALAFLMIGFSDQFWAIMATLAVFGFFSGAMDVSMNAMASRYEKRHLVSAMSFYHAMFSVGTGAGAFLGAFFLSQAFTMPQFFCALIALFSVGTLLFTRLTADKKALSSDAVEQGQPRFGYFFLLLAVMVFGCSVGEGGIADWAAVYLVDTKEAPTDIAALAFGVFSLAMVAMRVSGGIIIDRFGESHTLYACGVMSLIGLILVSVSDQYFGIFLGFALAGFGYANIIPLGFSMVAKRGSEEGKMIAYLSVFGYGGMLLGPVILGLISTLIGIEKVFTGLAGITLCMTVAIHLLARHHGRQHTSHAP